MAQRLHQLFPDEAAPGAQMEVLRGSTALEEVQTRVRALVPGNDAQRALQSRAQQVLGDFAQARWLTFERTFSSTPPAFLVVLVSWLAAMFTSFGLFAPRHATAIAALLIGALSVSTAIFLIEEMNHPLDGIIAISAEPLRNALALLGK
jgi:pyrroline-5-carboxylate reductase